MTNAMISAEDQKKITDKIYFNRLKILHEHLLNPTLPALILCSTLVFLGLIDLENKLVILTWYIATLLVCAIRYGLAEWYKRDLEHLDLHLKLFILGATLSGCMWGIAGTLLTPPHDLMHKVFIIIIIAGLNAGGCQTLRASRAANSLFVLTSILPLAIWTLSQEKLIYTYLSLSIFGYMAFMLSMAHVSYLHFIHALQLYYENSFLLKKLEQTNLELHDEIFLHENAKTRLRYVASHDYLTGIDNRLSFDSKFDQLLIHTKMEDGEFCVMYIDVDHFKSVNDIHGHDAGDTLLIEVVKQIKKYLRPQDILARMGGDEFIILMPAINVKPLAEEFCQQVYMTFKQPFILKGKAILISLSIGCSFYPADGDTKNILLKKADMALYQAKIMGRNQYVFYKEEEFTTEE